MELTKCPECGYRFSKDIEVCPKCGLPIGKIMRDEKNAKINKKRNVLLIGGIGLITIILIIIAINSTKVISYDNAITNIEKGNFSDAEEALEKLGDYKDAKRYLEIADFGSDLEYLSMDDYVADLTPKELDEYNDAIKFSGQYKELTEVRQRALINLKNEVERLSNNTNSYDDMHKAYAICLKIDEHIELGELYEICSDAFFDMYFD